MHHLKCFGEKKSDLKEEESASMLYQCNGDKSLLFFLMHATDSTQDTLPMWFHFICTWSHESSIIISIIRGRKWSRGLSDLLVAAWLATGWVTIQIAQLQTPSTLNNHHFFHIHCGFCRVWLVVLLLARFMASNPFHTLPLDGGEDGTQGSSTL